jgi:hypothetical protein
MTAIPTIRLIGEFYEKVLSMSYKLPIFHIHKIRIF